MRRTTVWSAAGLTALLLAAGACDDSTSPNDASVSLSLALAGAGPSTSMLTPLTDISIGDGEDTLVISRVAIVLREIELKRLNDDDCVIDSDDDSCEEFEVGPVLLEVDVNGGVDQVVAIDVPADTYRELEFDVHKPDNSEPEGQAFIAANPDFDGVSIRVEGTFNGEAFVFEQDLNEEQEIDLNPAVVVREGEGPVNLTLTLDVSTWFMDGVSVIDPRTANAGGDNEQTVEDNIRNSIDLFEDRDSDGERDDS